MVVEKEDRMKDSSSGHMFRFYNIASMSYWTHVQGSTTLHQRDTGHMFRFYNVASMRYTLQLRAIFASSYRRVTGNATQTIHYYNISWFERGEIHIFSHNEYKKKKNQEGQ